MAESKPTAYVVLERFQKAEDGGEELFKLVGRTTAHGRRAAVRRLVKDADAAGRHFKAVPASSWRTVQPRPPAPPRTLWEELDDDG